MPPDNTDAPTTRRASAAAAAAAIQEQQEELEQMEEVVEESTSTTTGSTKIAPDPPQSQFQPHDGYHSLSHAYETYLAHDKQEQNHWQDVCRSYRQYATFAMAQWANHQYRLYNAMTAAQRKVLPPALVPQTADYQQRARMYKEAAIRNQFVLDCVLRHAGQEHSQEASSSSSTTIHSSDSQMSKVSSVLKSLVRDWSEEGQKERAMTYDPIKGMIQKYLPLTTPECPTSAAAAATGQGATSRPVMKISVPGAGVGRLACELASFGYTVQGNEFSLYMLLASDFILNGGMATPEKPMRISPYLLESRNVHGATDPTRPITIPDVDPYWLLMGSASNYNQVEVPDFSMAGGEFVSIYSAAREKGAWDGVVACFFLDTAPCIVEYLQVIHHMLRPGGYLINFGPLLWHWSGPAMRPDDRNIENYHGRYSYLDKKYMQSVDFSWEDVRQIIINVGFEIVEEHLNQDALYTADPRSMMNMNYRCVHFVARRNEGEAADLETTKPSSRPTAAPTAPQGAG